MRHLIDKGAKLNDKLITSEYYKQLRNLLYQGDDSQTLFHKIQKRIFESLIQDFCKETGRDITPHRFKVGGVTRIYNTTGAIRAAQRFADHEDILTTCDTFVIAVLIATSDIDMTEINRIDADAIVNIIKASPDHTLFTCAKLF